MACKLFRIRGFRVGANSAIVEAFAVKRRPSGRPLAQQVMEDNRLLKKPVAEVLRSRKIECIYYRTTTQTAREKLRSVSEGD